jgi:hypothetical protein
LLEEIDNLFYSWLALSENVELFWSSTIIEITKMIDGKNAKLKSYRNDLYIHADLVRVGFNSPNNFPSFNDIWQYDKEKIEENEELRRQMNRENVELSTKKYFNAKKYFVKTKKI